MESSSSPENVPETIATTQQEESNQSEQQQHQQQQQQQQPSVEDSPLPFSGLEEKSVSNDSIGNDNSTAAVASTEAVAPDTTTINPSSPNNNSTHPEQSKSEPSQSQSQPPQRPMPPKSGSQESHETGSFRFYSDEGVEAPDEDGHLQNKIMVMVPNENNKYTEENTTTNNNEEVAKEDADNTDPDLMFPELAVRGGAPPPEVEEDNNNDNESITDSVVNEPHPESSSQMTMILDKNNRVSSRLLLAQEKSMVPVHHSRGSEVALKQNEFYQMKHHLHHLVQAAEVHLQSTLELQTAQQAFFACLADLADDTPLKGVVGTAANHSQTTTVLSPPQQGPVVEPSTLVQKYQREILGHAQDWQDAVSRQVDGKLQEFHAVERKYFHCNTKTAKLRKRARNADDWNLEFVLKRLEPQLQASEQELSTLIEQHKESANETCFLLDQVTAHGWKDLYPLVEATMEWEVDRCQLEEDTNGQVLPVALEQLQASFQILEQEELNQPKSVHGMALPTTVEEEDENVVGEHEHDDGVEETKESSEPTTAPSSTAPLQIDPHKPTLFLDDADPFTARVWIALLEKESDPLNPTGFHVIPVSNISRNDPGLQLLQNMTNQSKSPVLVHNGNIFSDSIRVSEYIDKAIRHPLYHSIPSLLPCTPIDTFNMKTFLKRHAKISDVFYNLMDSDDDDARPQLAQELFDLLGLIDKDLQKFPGPYLCGSQFTLADVSIFPFVEHINIILASFGGTSIPESLSFLLEWYEVVSRRPSVQMVTADPKNNSNNEQSSQRPRKKRGEYLIEYHQQRCDVVTDV